MARLETEQRKKWLGEFPCHTTLIEPAFGSTVGAPDANILLDELPCWVEFKVAGEDGTFYVRKRQRIWHTGFLTAGGKRALFVVTDREGWWAFPSGRVVLPSPSLGKVPPANVYSLGGRKIKWSSLPHHQIRDMLSRMVEDNG